MILRTLLRGGYESIINLPSCVIFSSSAQHSGCKYRGGCSFVVLLVLVNSSTTQPVL